MLRWLDHLLMSLLVALSMILIVLWFRSHAIGDRYRWMQVTPLDRNGVIIESRSWALGEGGFAIASDRSATRDAELAQRLRLRAERSARRDPPGYTRSDDPRYPGRGVSSDSLLALVGIHFARDLRDDQIVRRERFDFAVPLWLPLILVLSYPLARFVRGVIVRDRQDRIMLGLCPRCGINVRHAPERCPVCGLRQPLHAPPLGHVTQVIEPAHLKSQA